MDDMINNTSLSSISTSDMADDDVSLSVAAAVAAASAATSPPTRPTVGLMSTPLAEVGNGIDLIAAPPRSVVSEPPPPPTTQEPLPRVMVGAESWHNGLPTTWLPVITRDLERQRRNVS